MSYIIIPIAIILLVFLLYFLERDKSVELFLLYLNRVGYDVLKRYVAYNYTDTEDSKHEIENLKSIWTAMCCISNKRYLKMVFSFKPLTEENWLTETEIDFLNSDFSKIEKRNEE